MILARWSATSRAMSGARVDDSFAIHRDEILLFAFTTDRMEVGEHRGQFSVKLVTRGEERYRIGRRLVCLRPGQVLILNPGQVYASSIEQPGTQSLSFFLPPASLADMVGALTRSDAALLDAPGCGDLARAVLQVPFRPRAGLARALARLTAEAQAHPAPAPDRLEELVMDAAALALADALDLVPPQSLEHCVHRATREELVTRVLRARDLIHDTGGRVALPQMASEACLSPFHFLRVFRAVFQTTPARYARGVRLERALDRRRRGASPESAARTAGYGSRSAFARALRQHLERRS
ncbi:MAG TPA: AraC family transcriptional regulator [Terriglobales bacterium]|nr:AraC family transcriptional regulator [Terriglobales bacterium]